MSDLHIRLARLGVGAQAASATVPLADRIARLRTRTAAIRAPRLNDTVLAGELGGSVLAAGLVEVVRSFRLPLSHGAIRLAAASELVEGIRLSAPDCVTHSADALLFLDTETTGLAGGTGTTAFLLGVASVRDETLVVRQLLMTGFAGERPLLEALLAAFARTACIVSFNGKSFDLPLLRSRARLAHLAWPDEMPMHLDLLHVSRRRLREGWPDCRLHTAEQNALGFERTDDLPGAEVPAAWLRWLQRGDASLLPRILDHNREDLLSLAGLLAVLAHPTAREAPLLHAARSRQTAGLASIPR